MFNKDSDKNIQSGGAETLIGPSIKVKGDFHGDGDIIIEGSVEGDISTKQFISVGAQSIILANISANSARIAGKVTGDLRISSYVEILKTANIQGNIYCEDISIEKGAKLNGKVSMGKQAPVQAEEK